VKGSSSSMLSILNDSFTIANGPRSLYYFDCTRDKSREDITGEAIGS
jgi:hypothetical protein